MDRTTHKSRMKTLNVGIIGCGARLSRHIRQEENEYTRTISCNHEIRAF